MTLDDETAARIAREVVDGGKATLAILDESPTERETPADEWEYRARASDDSTLWFGVSVDRVAQLAEAGYEVQRRRVVGDWDVVPDDRA